MSETETQDLLLDALAAKNYAEVRTQLAEMHPSEIADLLESITPKQREKLWDQIEPTLEGDLRFVDSETGETLDITNAGELLNLYHDHRIWHQETLHQQCRSRKGRFASIRSDSSLEEILLDTLCRQGWVLR